eukprot:TRINITY_DN2244_c0_g1_i2.p1 TRINITY_DN2244_c0_g1~~TRINITY_DN2244_c0_g1_i2.p1  ORF type:complete len:623 (-),score=193.30 TRINITY_DN2244_c0_g1_i2:60-1928(-)
MWGWRSGKKEGQEAKINGNDENFAATLSEKSFVMMGDESIKEKKPVISDMKFNTFSSLSKKENLNVIPDIFVDGSEQMRQDMRAQEALYKDYDILENPIELAYGIPLCLVNTESEKNSSHHYHTKKPSFIKLQKLNELPLNIVYKLDSGNLVKRISEQEVLLSPGGEFASSKTLFKILFVPQTENNNNNNNNIKSTPTSTNSTPIKQNPRRVPVELTKEADDVLRSESLFQDEREEEQKRLKRENDIKKSLLENLSEEELIEYDYKLLHHWQNLEQTGFQIFPYDDDSNENPSHLGVIIHSLEQVPLHKSFKTEINNTITRTSLDTLLLSRHRPNPNISSNSNNTNSVLHGKLLFIDPDRNLTSENDHDSNLSTSDETSLYDSNYIEEETITIHPIQSIITTSTTSTPIKENKEERVRDVIKEKERERQRINKSYKYIYQLSHGSVSLQSLDDDEDEIHKPENEKNNMIIFAEEEEEEEEVGMRLEDHFKLLQEEEAKQEEELIRDKKKCKTCHRIVYFWEEVSLDAENSSIVAHKSCFVCEYDQCGLNLIPEKEIESNRRRREGKEREEEEGGGGIGVEKDLDPIFEQEKEREEKEKEKEKENRGQVGTYPTRNFATLGPL